MILIDGALIINWFNLGLLHGFIATVVYLVIGFVVGWINGWIIQPFYLMLFNQYTCGGKLWSDLGCIYSLIRLYSTVLQFEL